MVLLCRTFSVVLGNPPLPIWLPSRQVATPAPSAGNDYIASATAQRCAAFFQQREVSARTLCIGHDWCTSCADAWFPPAAGTLWQDQLLPWLQSNFTSCRVALDDTVRVNSTKCPDQCQNLLEVRACFACCDLHCQARELSLRQPQPPC